MAREKASRDDMLLMNLLRTMATQSPEEKPRFSFTEDEVVQRYNKKYPRGFLARLIPRDTGGEIRKKLAILFENGLVGREVTRYTNKALKKDVSVYSITAKGRDFLNPQAKGKK